MSRRLTSLAAALSLAAAALAQHPSIFPAAFKAPNRHHTGDIWLTSLAEASETFPYNMTVANSAPGARLNWHAHPGGQRLAVTEGLGYYRERGQPARLMRPGDVIECPPGVEHFHAANPERGVVYLALYGGGATVWGEPVTDEEYAAVPGRDETRRKREAMALSQNLWRWRGARQADSVAQVLAAGAQYADGDGARDADALLAMAEAGTIRGGGSATDAEVVVAGDVAVVTHPLPGGAVAVEVYAREAGTCQLRSLTIAPSGE